MSLKVNEPSEAWEAGKETRELIDALLGGTSAMRKAGEKYMPRFEMECEDDYKKRLDCATLFPVYSETVRNMAARVFYRPINRDEVEEGLKADIENIDLQGNDLDVYAAEWFEMGLAHGLCHTLVDYPKTSGLSSRVDGIVTQGDLKKASVRPYVRMVMPHDLVGWIVERVNNIDTLVQVRIRETACVRDGDYGTKEVERIRVIEPGRYEVWEQSGKDKSDMVLIEEGANSLEAIPLVTFYTGRSGILTANPPLLELANLNIKHWQEQSDQDASVRFARVRMVWASGLDNDTKLSASADSIITLPQGGEIGVVQGSAESVTVGAESLTKLEEQMRESGARLLAKQSQATKTVAQARSDAIVEQSALGSMAQSLEDAIDQVLDFMAQYRGIKSGGGHVDVNDDFDALDDQSMGADALVKLVAMNIISEATAFNECKRRGLISNELEWIREKELILTGGEDDGVAT